MGLFVQAEEGDARDYVLVTARGMIKRSPRPEYRVRKKKFSALPLKDGDSVISAFETDGAGDVLLITQADMSIRFALASVPQVGRAGAGVSQARPSGITARSPP